MIPDDAPKVTGLKPSFFVVDANGAKTQIPVDSVEVAFTNKDGMQFVNGVDLAHLSVKRECDARGHFLPADTLTVTASWRVSGRCKRCGVVIEVGYIDGGLPILKAQTLASMVLADRAAATDLPLDNGRALNELHELRVRLGALEEGLKQARDDVALVEGALSRALAAELQL